MLAWLDEILIPLITSLYEAVGYLGLAVAMAVDALGPENVRCVMLPSRYTSQSSLDDAAACARALGCQLDTVQISAPQDAATAALAGYPDGVPGAEVGRLVRAALSNS